MATSAYLEEISSQIPAIQLLQALGYIYLTPAEAMVQRGGKTSSVLLEPILADWLRVNNTASYKGQSYPFEESNIQSGIKRLRDEPLLHGLIQSNKTIYEQLLSAGTSLKQTIDGDSRSYTLNYINWKAPHKNVFHVTEEFVVNKPGSSETLRPDIVCFVNGIPFVIIECKRPDLKSKEENPALEAVSQMIRNQREDGIPNLFLTSQLLIGTSRDNAHFATTGTPMAFWSIWRETDLEEAVVEKRVRTLINQPLSELEKQHLYDWRKWGATVRTHFDQLAAGGERWPTAQDRLLWALLRPERLLELIYQFVVFDGDKKKIARYQQYFAVKDTVARVAHLNSRESRTGGVIWHTTGSGKSLTMVMLAKALALHPNIPNPRVVVVTDRVNLDRQIFDTFVACGKRVAKAKNGRDLVNQIAHGKTDVITTVIDKFETAERLRARDDSPNIFVLVDESHRSQYGTSHAKMKRVFPKACYIGFTGTPLLKKEKVTAVKFGGFIHKYTMRQAVADGAVVPLLYEGRIVELDVDKKAMDRWFDYQTRTLTDEEKADLKRKFSRKEEITKADRRIQEIAFDISEHYRKTFKNTGFKAQLATASKEMGLKYKRYLDELGELRCELLISAPDSREGHTEIDAALPELQAFWQQMMSRYKTEKEYNREIRNSFGAADGVELIIVVDKLLTGFDEPRNRVLYIDKPLKAHNLLQAIARVNRLYEDKEYGLIIDYRGVLGELNKAMQTYNALEMFDAEDVAGTVTDVSVEIDKLPHYHSVVWDVFKLVENNLDIEQMVAHLRPEDRRHHFYETLNEYARTLQIALAADYFYDRVSPKQIERYKTDLKQFHSLRTTARQRYAEAVNYKEYERKIRKLIDTHIGASGVAQVVAQVSVFDEQAFAAEVEAIEGTAAKADTIAHRMKRAISENMEKDPVFYRKFSQMIDETIQAYYDQRIDERTFLREMEAHLHEMQQGGEAKLPQKLKANPEAAAYFRLLKEPLAEYKVTQSSAAEIALAIEQIIDTNAGIDWVRNEDIKRKISSSLGVYLFNLAREEGFALNVSEMNQWVEQLLNVAQHRYRPGDWV